MDPIFLGGIKAYMENADLDAIPAIRARAIELLEVSPGVDVGRVVDLVVGAIERNVNRAFRADRDAAYHESRRSAKQIAGTIESAEQRIAARIADANPREDLASMSSKLANIERALTPAGPDAAASANAPVSGPERTMADLAASRPDDEPNVRELWHSSTPAAIASLVTEPDAWLLSARPEVWLALARLLGHAGQHATALVAYDEALQRGIGDRARTLVRASSVARLDGQSERSAELLAHAIDEDDQHPAVVLRTVEDADNEPADVLRRLADFTSDDPADLAIAEVLRGQAALLLEDYPEAHLAAGRALKIDPGNLGALRLRGLATFVPAQKRYAGGSRTDTAALDEALTDFTSARDRLREQRRYDESGHMAALIAETHVILDDPKRREPPCRGRSSSTRRRPPPGSRRSAGPRRTDRWGGAGIAVHRQGRQLPVRPPHGRALSRRRSRARPSRLRLALNDRGRVARRFPRQRERRLAVGAGARPARAAIPTRLSSSSPAASPSSR